MDFKKKYLKYKYKYLKLKQFGGDPPSRRINKEIDQLNNNKDIQEIEWNNQESALTFVVNEKILTFIFNVSRYPFSAPKLKVDGKDYPLSRLLPYAQWTATQTLQDIITNFIRRDENTVLFDQELRNKIANNKRSQDDRKVAAKIQEDELKTDKKEQEELMKIFEEKKQKEKTKENNIRIIVNLMKKLRDKYIIRETRQSNRNNYSFILETGKMNYPLTLKIELTDKIPYTVLLTHALINNSNSRELPLNQVEEFLNNPENRMKLLWENVTLHLP
jgi:hypothetical protein